MVFKDFCVSSQRMVIIAPKHVRLFMYYTIMLCMYFVGLITAYKLYIFSKKINGKLQIDEGMYI